MSIYSTLTITRERAEEMVLACRMKNDRSVKILSDEELDAELHEYVYSNEGTHRYDDIIGWAYNYSIEG